MEEQLKVNKVNLAQKLSLFSEHWSPKIVGELNGQYIKLVKFKGEFVWHKHDDEDELFFVVNGKFKIEFRDKVVELNKNEFIIVTKGVEHRPVAEEEASVMLFEPISTINTGNLKNHFTEVNPQQI
jgi:mannose-6-phosphate isomerase-like protein (cupin superfamily)